jgi:molybdopterin converting factor small subunit
MKVSVLFFGATADEAGMREIEIDFPAGTRAADALRAIIERFPKLAPHKLLFAVNQEYASGGEMIGEGDELAVFTAVSGG